MENNTNINSFDKGLFLDTSIGAQPKGTYRYAINIVDETSEGDLDRLSNEEGDYLFTALKTDYIPLGNVYIGDKRFVIWSVKADETVSEIGILDIKSKKYETHVNDLNSIVQNKLNFRLTHQIYGVYRLRGGCDITVYWTDKNSPARYYNFSNPENFKDGAGNWVKSKFNLQRTYEKIPEFTQMEVLDSGGSILSGSYNAAIQLVDADLNPTEWITTSPVVKIYKDILSKEYSEINGSVNSTEEHLNFGPTNKSIKINLSSLDTNYPYFRVAMIAANSGSGLVNKVYVSDVQSTDKPEFIFNGNNYVSEGSLTEIAMFNNILGKVGHIEQIENRLILGDIESEVNNYCTLQKYASQIQTDCIVKKVVVNSLESKESPKNPTCDFNGGNGYMPGEIYAKGIVYILEGMVFTPAFHIAGKPAEDVGKTYTSGSNVYPMSIDNTCASTYYTEGNNSSNFWGTDYKGVPLLGKKVRHHRLPTRAEIGLPLVVNSNGAVNTSSYYYLQLTVQGVIKTPVPCPADKPNCGTDITNATTLRIEYKVDGELNYFTTTIDPNTYSNNVDRTYTLRFETNSRYHTTNAITDVKIELLNLDTTYTEIATADFTPFFEGTPNITTTIKRQQSSVQNKLVEANIFGMRHTNILKPTKEEMGGKEVIGYMIVRLDRTEFDKTILDSAVLFPTTVNSKYISHGLLQPQGNNTSKDVFAILHPEHKFKHKEYYNFDSIKQMGNYVVSDRKFGKVNFDDVYDGSSFDSKAHKEGNDDGQPADGSPTSRGFDGWSFNLISRDNIVNYQAKSNFTIDKENVKEFFYLNSLESRSINDSANEVFNISSDNKIGILQTKGNLITDNLPYVYLTKKNSDPYSNFRNLPYYKESVNPTYFGGDNKSTANVYGGDTYISSIRYSNSIYWDNRVADRKGKKSILKIILGVVVAIAGAVLAAGTLGAGTILVGAGVSLIGAGTLFASSGLKIANFNRTYAEEYEKGLRQTALDSWTDMFYNYKNNIPFGYTGDTRKGHGQSGPSDDTIQWGIDAVTDLWFESPLNISLRNAFSEDQSPTFLPSPGKIETGNTAPIDVWEFYGTIYTNSNQQRYPVSTLERYGARKLLVYDDTRDDNRYYLGAALGDYYNINPDYERKNQEKTFYMLPISYNCCSSCAETFPHRWHWSEQSFQEEVTDNYRVFLPNNYRDIEGESGPITNMFRLSNNFFIQTREAIWQVPRNQQERVTDQIVSFIGTGEYFSIPPVKIVDDSTGNSAGLQHKSGFLKTPQGVYYISAGQGQIVHFNGQQVKPILQGIANWGQLNIPMESEKRYYADVYEDYPFSDNTSNPFGNGYALAYDNLKSRILITKTDIIYPSLMQNNSKFALKNGKLVRFANYSSILTTQSNSGWDFEKEENGSLIFSRDTFKTYTYNSYRNGAVITETGSYPVKEFKNIEGELIVSNLNPINNSWTLSYSLKIQAWRSWHSYLPKNYISAAGIVLSNDGDNRLYAHNKKGLYNTFRNKKYPTTIEYVSSASPLLNTVTDGIAYKSIAEQYDSETETFIERPDITFNELMVYNTRQNTGKLTVNVRDDNNVNYLWDAVIQSEMNIITANNVEGTWQINQLRDVVVNYNKPMFIQTLAARQESYYTDKVLNTSVIDYNKDWTQLESFRDKYLAIRLTFNNFEDIKLSFSYSVSDEKQSYR